MERFFISTPILDDDKISKITSIPEIDAKATTAQTTADTVQKQMNALTSAFATEEDANA